MSDLIRNMDRAQNVSISWCFPFNINDRQGGDGRVMWGIFVVYYADYEEKGYY